LGRARHQELNKYYTRVHFNLWSWAIVISLNTLSTRFTISYMYKAIESTLLQPLRVPLLAGETAAGRGRPDYCNRAAAAAGQ
jgi:hypothetical protein